MLNVVFIIVVMVLQLQKDCLHIEWPFGPKFNHTVIPCNGDTNKEVSQMIGNNSNKSMLFYILNSALGSFEATTGTDRTCVLGFLYEYSSHSSKFMKHV